MATNCAAELAKEQAREAIAALSAEFQSRKSLSGHRAMRHPGARLLARTKYFVNFGGYCSILVASTATPAEHPFRFTVLAISSPRLGVRG